MTEPHYMENEDLEAIVNFMDSRAYRVIMERLQDREEINIRYLLSGGAAESDDVLRGRVREMTDLARWLTRCVDEHEERLKKNAKKDVDLR